MGTVVIILLAVAIYVLACTAAVILIVIASRSKSKSLGNDVVEAKVIEENPIIHRQAVHTGYTVSYGRRHEHYKYEDVITGWQVTFSVLYKNGKRKIIKCKKDDIHPCKRRNNR